MMKKILIALLILILPMMCVEAMAKTVKAPAVQAASASDSLTQSLGNYTTYSADFTQTTTSSKKGVTIQKSQGKVMMARPGRFRWEVLKPNHQLIVANGDMLWIYDADLQQAIKQKLKQQNKGFNPAELLTRPLSDLKRQFHITVRDKGWFELRPLKADPNFSVVRLQFADKRLVALEMVNRLGEDNKCHFTNIHLNQTIDKKMFSFVPAKGVDVISNDHHR